MQKEFKRGNLKNTSRIIEMMTRMAAGTWLMIALTAVVATTEATTSHAVGGRSMGWTIPTNTSFYSQWASSQKFAVGDTLLFNFTNGQHNVAEVPKASYDSCSTKNQIGSTLTTSPATITITTPGNHYYICGVTGHCSIGQKLTISVPAASSSAPAPAPAAGTPAPAAAPGSSKSMGPAASPSSSTPTVPATLIPPSSSGTSSGPSSSNPGNSQVPIASSGPSGGGSTPSSAPSSPLSSLVIIALLSATTAFLM